MSCSTCYLYRVGVGMTGEGESEGEIDRFHVHTFLSEGLMHTSYILETSYTNGHLSKSLKLF